MFFHYNDLQSKAAGIKKALEQMQSMLLMLIFNYSCQVCLGDNCFFFNVSEALLVLIPRVKLLGFKLKR